MILILYYHKFKEYLTNDILVSLPPCDALLTCWEIGYCIDHYDDSRRLMFSKDFDKFVQKLGKPHNILKNDENPLEPKSQQEISKILHKSAIFLINMCVVHLASQPETLVKWIDILTRKFGISTLIVQYV